LGKRGESRLFDAIAPVYGLFFHWQKKRFLEIIDGMQKELDLSEYSSVLDVGCGTGALCSALSDKGMKVTGVDPAARMLSIAKRRPENKGVTFIRASALERLPFEDRSFDIVICSYVAHGLNKDGRKKLYTQMGRLARDKVVIHDYNQNRRPLISLIEWLEHGDYFGFIKVARDEMENCVSDMKQCFARVEAVDVGPNAAWYICTPRG